MRAFSSTSLSITLVLCATAVAAAPDAAPTFQQAFERFRQGLDAGDEDALEEAIEAFTVLGRRAPSDHRFTVYLGSAITLRARHTVWPWKKISHVEEGLELIDEALDARIAAEHDPISDGVPASLTIELVASETLLSIPDFFNRGEEGKRLAAELAADPRLASAPAAFRAAVALRGALLAEADGDEQGYRAGLARAAELDGQGPDGARARRLLNGASQ